MTTMPKGNEAEGRIMLTRMDIFDLQCCLAFAESLSAHLKEHELGTIQAMRVYLQDKVSAAAEAEEKVCPTCGGRGSVTNPMADPPDCPSCSGSGVAVSPTKSATGRVDKP